MTRRAVHLAILLLCLAAATAGSARASEPNTPWWWVGQEVVPGNLPPEGEGEPGRQGEGTIIVLASDLGDASIHGSGGDPVVITDKLPPALTATAITTSAKNGITGTCVLATVQCTVTGAINPYERIGVTIKVKVNEPSGTVNTLDNEMRVEGGDAPQPATTTTAVHISGTHALFGLEEGFSMIAYNDEGGLATQAGTHPFELTSTIAFNQSGEGATREPVAMPRNVRFKLPLGLIGDPQATEQCSSTTFTAHAPLSEVDLCPAGSVVGVASITVNEPAQLHVINITVPVFNLVPSEGEPARFGFEALGLVPVVINTAVDPSDDYAVIASVRNASQLTGVLSSQVTLWGVPGDPRHNRSRGWECINNGVHFQKGEVATPCPASTSLPQTPLLTLPTACAKDPAAEPVTTGVEAESWAQQGYVAPPAYVWSGPLGEPLGFDECEQLPFTPSISAIPETGAASTPTGLTISVRVPQATTLEAEGHAEADVRSTNVTLPAGMQVSPSAANGLRACSETDIGFTGFQDFEPGSPTATFGEGFDFIPPLEPTSGESFCPEASKLGTVRIRTPLLPTELQGAVYLAEPAPNGESGKNPFDSLVALYLVAEDKQAGVLVKLAGDGKLDQSTGQVTTTFENTPQLPFEELTLQLFGVERASLTTPALCGGYQASSVFDAWSGAVAESVSEPFQVSSGAGGGTCPSGPLGFSPGFLAQSDNPQAGGFSPFEVEIARPDGQQALSGVSVSLPPGVAALLSGVTPCAEPPPGVEWDCGPESLIGHSLAWSGLGSEPVQLPGEAFLTSGYDGAPFGLLVRTKARAGPFDLGYVNVRSRINVNPETAAVTVTTDPGPHGDALITILKGIPVQLKRLRVAVDRPDFEFNPTSCDPMSVQGSLSGSEGATAAVSSRFQVGGCGSLAFHPVLTASVGGHANKADGTGFNVDIASQGLGVANIKKVELQIPAQLPSRQSTLSQACLAATFQSNPASCPEGSVIGAATVHTPVLKSPLTGPAYLVSYGNAKFPDVEFVLQGEGITLILDGHTDIKQGVTYSRFEAAPDEPFTSFETSLPAGPHGILTAYASEKEPYELCPVKLTMPTTITAQDGAVLQQNTPVTPAGCNGVLAKKTTKPTRAQQLAKALASCRHRYRSKHAKPKRLACEAQARKRYGPVKKKTTHKAKKPAKHRG